MNIPKISVLDIEIGDRLREVDEDKAELIAASFREIGQSAPILVQKRDEHGKYKLIAGAHRIRAAVLAEMTHVLAIIHSGTNAEVQLMEIDENLLRADLTVMDRDVFLVRRKEIYEALHPETVHGGDAKTKAELGQVGNFANLAVDRFTKDTAERLGVSEAVIQKSVHRGKKITPEARKRLTGTRFADNASHLQALANLDALKQLQAVELLSGDQADRPATLKEAVDRVTGRVEDGANPDQKLYDAFIRLWGRCNPDVRDRIAEFAASEARKAKKSRKSRDDVGADMADAA